MSLYNIKTTSKNAKSSTNSRMAAARALVRASKFNSARVTSIRAPFVVRRPTDELKNLDLNFGNQFQFGLATSVSALLNPIAVGNDASTRIGRKVVMKSLFIRMHVAKSATSTGESPLRMLIVYDSQTNAGPALPLGTDVVTTPDRMTSQMNLANSGRFKVILDREWRFGSADNTTLYFKKYIKLPDLPVMFNTVATATITAIQTGSLVMYTWHNGGLTVSNPTHFIETRIRYSD